MFMLKVMQVKLPNRVTILFLVIALFKSGTGMAQTPDAAYLSGCAYLKKGNLPQALEKFSVAISRNNADERLFICRGQVSMGLKDYENAIRDFNEANEILPGVSDIWLARAYSLAGDQARALSFLKSHLSSGFRLPEDSIKKDPAFDRIQNSQGWYSLWEQEWYNDEEKTSSDVAYDVRKGFQDKAMSQLDAEIGRSPSGAGLFMLRGEVNYTAGNYALAIADYSTAIDLYKNKERGVIPLEGLKSGKAEVSGGGPFALRGQAYLKAGRFKDAISDYNRVLKDNPAFFPAYLNRAEAYAGLKSYDVSIRDVQTYLQYFENDLQAVFQCGEYYFLTEDYINALKYFNRNLKEDPVNSKYFKARGKAYLKAGTYRYAISDLSMSLDLNPDDSETWMYIGLAKSLSGDRENGCSDLEKARQLGNTEVLKYIIENCQ
jgi:tetratricopeptide (TPR) repeat protein